MQEYGFSLTHFFPYNDRTIDSVLIRENTGQWKPVFSHILRSGSFEYTNVIFIKFWRLCLGLQEIQLHVFFKLNLSGFNISIRQTRFSVSSQGWRLWSKLFDEKQKTQEHKTSFKKSVKLSLFSLENEIKFF